MQQLNQFAGNVLEVLGNNGTQNLVMSDQAYQAFTPKQIQLIENHCKIIHSSLYTIESNGGGSARCMMAEIFLEERKK